MILQLASIIGAVMVLVAYLLTTSLGYSPRNRVVLLINGVGSVFLLIVAFVYFSVGYIFLDAAWIAIVIHGWKVGNGRG